MIFKKISILGLLVLCTIYDSESRYHTEHTNCGCSDNAKIDGTKAKPKNIQHDIPRDELENLQDEFTTDKKPNATTSLNKDHNDQSTIPVRYYQPHLNADPYITEALLKQIWLSHQLKSSSTPQGKDQKFNPETKWTQIYPQQDSFEIPSYKDIDKLDKQRNNEFDANLDNSDHSDDSNHSDDFFHDKTGDDEDDNVTDPSFDEDLNSGVDNTVSDYDQNDNNDNDQRAVTPLANLENFGYHFPYYKMINNNKQKPDTLSTVVIPLFEHNFAKQQEDALPPYIIPRTKYEQQIKIASPRLILRNYNDLTAPEHSFYKQEDTPQLHKKPYREKNVNKPKVKIALPRIIIHSYDGLIKPKNLPDSFPMYQQSDTYNNINYNIPYKYDSSIVSDEQRYRLPAVYIAPKNIQKEPTKLDKWILGQLKTLDAKNQRPDEVDLRSLGYSILQILMENGMSITDNGMLIDPYGTVYNINSLHLTPIFIGNTMSLRHLLEGKYGMMSSKLKKPYLRAVLIFATQPLKILGVVSFGTTYLPLETLNNATITQNDIPKDFEQKELARDEVIDETTKEEPEKPDVKSTHSNSHKVFYEPASFNYKTVIDDQFINQEELESNAGRIFIPQIKFYDNPIDTLTRGHTSSIHEPARIHIPSMSGLIDIAFRSEKEGVSNVESNAPKISKKLGPISDVIVELGDSTKALLKLNLLKKNSLISAEPIIQNRRLQAIGDIVDPILSLKKLGRKATRLENGIKNPSIEELNVGSRSGDDPILVEIPPEHIRNSNSAFDVVENNDDDDGDFRIIGGNAATGSGTPLSNKGRSGYIF